jgi:hypothetical protein
VEAHFPDFLERMATHNRPLPVYVREAFDANLHCGVLGHGLLRVVCESCHAARRVAFSFKQRGFRTCFGLRRMAESARHLVEDVFDPRSVLQWASSLPYPFRFLFASKPDVIGPVIEIVQRVIGGWLASQPGIKRAGAHCAAVTVIERFGSALNLNIDLDVHGRTNAARAGTRRSGPHAVAGRRVRPERRGSTARAAPAPRSRARSHGTCSAGRHDRAPRSNFLYPTLLRSSRAVHRVVQEFRYGDAVRSATATGFVESHAVRGALPDGKTLARAECVVAAAVGGEVTDVREYMDTGAAASVIAVLR